ncbi:uncharacterized protein LOC123510042 isoform X2 [Portunus trituberculatus]|uniref:uncharacterized protein LOC123510042 isoform X2 n=1 Tax=Portunus trituberculatus TaxID=210409 RepID=UPI001E1CE288|nr:uncharacterized protein LOC123510042 isoform X2 [Portunus trituberculatus]
MKRVRTRENSQSVPGAQTERWDGATTMRETRWLSMQLAAGVAVMLVAAVSEVTAKPTPGDDTRHITANHVEDQYLDDALVNWLDNFGTYTFMVKQDLDSHAGDPDGGGEGDEEQEQESGAVEGGEREEVAALEEWSAPIAVSTGQRNLLNPHHDYLVTVESLVAEEGSIFMTLSKYENETICGVGGLSLEEELQQVPKSGGGGFVAQEESGSAGHTTFIAFALQQEENTNATDSGWIAVSEQYWWASGHLTGGTILSITFTPPECGCLALSTYFALPVGNLTLVVGPQAYPDELQTLLCVDPLASVPDHDYEEEGQENGIPEEEEEIDYLQQPSALVALRNPGEEGVEEATQATESPQQPTVLTQKKKMSKEKKMTRKTRRQMKRQRIRQAGRRQARQGQPNNGKKTTRRWNRKKNQRKRARVWKKLNKKGKKGRRGKLGAKHHHQHNHDEEVNGTNPEEMRQHHDHHHHHSAYPTNVSAIQHEERLVDILLRDLYAENSTVEEDGEGEEGDATMRNEEGEGQGEGGAQTPRERRKNRRQRKKKMRKQRRKVYGPGVKFCCKQGVKHKKNNLEISNTSAIFAECNTSIDVVITFANHQFGIEEDTCTTTYTTCCENFTEDMWESIKARKAERRTERKQRRKSRRRDRKQRRKQERRLRKGMRRQGNSRHHDHQCTGDTCGQAN